LSKPNAGTDTGKDGLPRSFTQAEMDQIMSFIKANGGLANPGNPPTTLAHCMVNNHHGGPKGDRKYYPRGSVNLKTGEWDKGPAVCEICGTVGVDD
jgi:hypothetical protein